VVTAGCKRHGVECGYDNNVETTAGSLTFLLSIVALAVGPAIYAVGQKLPTARQVLDGFVFITIAGIVCVHIVPKAIELGGLAATGFLVAGLVFPVLIERFFHQSMRRAHVFILILAALGLAMHAIIDGIALLPLEALVGSNAGALSNNSLALGVILHRLSVGMAIWWSLRPSLGLPVALGVFALIIAATAVGYFPGAVAVEFAELGTVACFQAFVAGSLVHVIAFGVSHDHAKHVEGMPQAKSWSYRVGILLGLFLVFTVPQLG
jgi:hypothetical protein